MCAIDKDERQTPVEMDAETRAALARCYLRFARRGRQLMAERAMQSTTGSDEGTQVVVQDECPVAESL